MHSWRDDVSDTAQAELDRLLDSALRVAQGKLAQAAEFEPIAILIDVDGRILEMALDTSTLGKHPSSQTLIDSALVNLRQVKKSARCTALIINTRLNKEKTDAVEVRLEHQDGGSLVVLLRYKRASFGNRIEYGELSAFSGSRFVWA
jgi:hypothetical protein